MFGSISAVRPCLWGALFSAITYSAGFAEDGQDSTRAGDGRPANQETLADDAARDLVRQLSEAQGMAAKERLVAILAGRYRTANEGNAPEAGFLLKAILTLDQPLLFQLFARQAGIPEAVQRQLMLAKPVQWRTDGHETLADCLRHLIGQTTIMVWIDDEVMSKGQQLPVAHAEGPWLTTVENVLSGTEYRLHLLAPGLLWIGSPRQLKAARKTYEESSNKIQWAASKPAEALTDYTKIQFTETPLNQVIKFLSDQHALNFCLLGTEEDPVTLNLRGLRLHLALTLMTQRLHYDWNVDREIIYVGPANELELVRLRALTGLRRWARLGTADTKIARALRSDTRLEFSETPLSQVARYLTSFHGAPVRAAHACAPMPVTMNLKGISLEQGLDATCLKLGLTWDTDGTSIEIGDEPLWQVSGTRNANNQEID